MIEALRRLIDGLISFFQGRGGGSAEERRKLIRVKCAYDVHCDVGEQRFPAVVEDIGLNGMRLTLKNKLKKGTSLTVHQPGEPGEGEEVFCKVRWCRRCKGREDFEIGVQYDDAIRGNLRRSWVKFLLKELGFDERSIFTRRKAVRADASLPCQLRCEDGRQHKGTAINLGVGGALYCGAQPLQPGERVRVRVGPFRKYKAFDLNGEVVTSQKTRKEEHQVSIRFVELNAGQVRMLGEYVIQLLRDAAH